VRREATLNPGFEKKLFLYALMLFYIQLVTNGLTQPVVITEIMASNNTTIEDGYGNSSDWIELYNLGLSQVDLSGWFLTDQPDKLNKWSFPPETFIKARGFMIVFASGSAVRVQKDPKGFLHTNFKLSKNGEYLALVKPNKKSITSQLSPTFPRQVTDVSYGFPIIAPTGSLIELGNKGYFSNPTPGTINAVSTSDMGSIIYDVQHQPESVDPGGLLVITAHVKPTIHPISLVNLHYRIMYDQELIIPMKDDGFAPDLLARDGIYSAIVRPSLAKQGQMIRYFIAVKDSSLTQQTRSPAFKDPKHSPQYYGTIVSAADLDSSKLPVFHWFVEDEKAFDRPINSNQRHGSRASIFFNGSLYDNVFCRVRGASAPSFSKKPYKFDFNPGNKFNFLPDIPSIEEVNLNANYQDKAKVREPLAYETYRKAGVPAPDSYQVRVQRNGRFFSIANLTEQIDEEFLSRRSLDPNGALYKMYNTGTSSTGGVRKQTRKEESNGDLRKLINGLKQRGWKGETFVFDNLDVPEIINYWAAGTLIQDFDRTSKNWYLYRDTNNSGEWKILPWDKDLTFGLMSLQTDDIRGNHDTATSGTSKVGHPFFGIYEDCCSGSGSDSGNKVMKALFETSRGKEMFLRRLRTLMDEILQPPGTRMGELFYESRLDERLEAMRSVAELDLKKWGRGFGAKQTLKQAITILSRKYLMERRLHLFLNHNINNTKFPRNADIPDAQKESFTLKIKSVDFSPHLVSRSEEYIEIQNPHSYAVDVSNFNVTGSIIHTFKTGTVIPSKSSLYLVKDVNSFRARRTGPSGGQGLFVQGNYEGKLSAHGGTITVKNALESEVAVLTYKGKLSDPQKFLRITELHYHPQLSDQEKIIEDFKNENKFEFVELTNTGQVSINLNGIKFDSAIEFVFPPITLKPGDFTLIVNNIAAFESRYGQSLPIAGAYNGQLSNSGEGIRLIDVYGSSILDFSYSDNWFTATDGRGYSMVIRNGKSDWKAWNHPSGWAISSEKGGSPGKRNGILVNEQFEGWLRLYHEDSEIHDPLLCGLQADYDRDGISTIIEYTLGLNPTQPNWEKLISFPVTIKQDNKSFLCSRISVASNRLDLNYRGEISLDLVNWTEIPIELHKLDQNRTEIWAQDPLPLGQMQRRYIRIQVIKKRI
jgi:hypothetical protein